MSEILTVDEVAAYLKVHRTTVYRLIRAGSLACFKVGSDYRFRRETVEKWMVDQEDEWMAAQRAENIGKY